MTDPLASWMWTCLTEPEKDDHVIVHMDVFDSAADVETTLRPPSSNPGMQRGREDVPEDGSKLAAASVYWGDAAHDPLEVRIKKEIREVRGKGEKLPSIWRVHHSIRGQESEAYEPKLVSIGPLHRSNKSLQPMEEVKLTYLDDLIKRSPKNSLSNYIRVIRDCEHQARKQYAEAVKPANVDEFVRMLVLDGCFIIEYLIKRIFGETRQTAQLSGVRWGFAHLRRDLMLFENQIPFFVLVKLFDQSEVPFEGTRKKPLTLMELALKFLRIKPPKEMYPKADEVLHLLHLHHLCLDPSWETEKPRRSLFGQLALYPIKRVTSLIKLVFIGLLYLLLKWKLPWHGFPTKKSSSPPRMIPCATKLHEAGVKFKKKEVVSCYLKVSFKEGTLEIPFLPIEESTSSKLRNFIALEQCCPKVGNHFTSYAVFTSNIITTKDDVAMLQKREIIESKLGNDEDVAKMFNTLCNGTHLNFDDHYNAPLFKDLKEYCELPHHQWRASLMSTHFSSPWSAISLVVAVLVFGLQVSNTSFTISRG